MSMNPIHLSLLKEALTILSHYPVFGVQSTQGDVAASPPHQCEPSHVPEPTRPPEGPCDDVLLPPPSWLCEPCAKWLNEPFVPHQAGQVCQSCDYPRTLGKQPTSAPEGAEPAAPSPGEPLERCVHPTMVCNECGDTELVLSHEPGEEGWYRCFGSCALHQPKDVRQDIPPCASGEEDQSSVFRGSPIRIVGELPACFRPSTHM